MWPGWSGKKVLVDSVRVRDLNVVAILLLFSSFLVAKSFENNINCTHTAHGKSQTRRVIWKAQTLFAFYWRWFASFSLSLPLVRVNAKNSIRPVHSLAQERKGEKRRVFFPGKYGSRIESGMMITGWKLKNKTPSWILFYILIKTWILPSATVVRISLSRLELCVGCQHFDLHEIESGHSMICTQQTHTTHTHLQSRHSPINIRQQKCWARKVKQMRMNEIASVSVCACVPSTENKNAWCLILNLYVMVFVLLLFDMIVSIGAEAERAIQCFNANAQRT